MKDIKWFLDCEPRAVQLEALRRSHWGTAHQEHKGDIVHEEPVTLLEHAGGPAKGFPYFMEMRLGKTPTALNNAVMFAKEYGANKIFVVSPSLYKEDWGVEAEKFGMGLHDFMVHVCQTTVAGRRSTKAFLQQTGMKMMVTNYESLRSDISFDIFEEFVDDKTVLILDESIIIKNRQAQTFVRCSMLGKQAMMIRILTGKPVVQGPQDLYSQLRISHLYNGVNFFQFRNRYCIMGGFKSKQVVGIKNEDELYRMLRKVSFIAKRRHWGTWFEPETVIRNIEMNQTQHHHYNEMEKDFVTWLQDGEAVSAEQIITKHMKMQQISSGFIYDEFKEPWEIGEFKKLPKFEALINDLTNYISGKTMVVAVYKPTIDNLMEHLKPWNPAVIRGQQKDTIEQKEKFNNDDSCKVIVCQETAVKYGHNLMGSYLNPCETVAYFENSYSLDDRAQSFERPQGEGQQSSTMSIDYVSSPIEKKVVDALIRKENIANAIVGHYS